MRAQQEKKPADGDGVRERGEPKTVSHTATKRGLKKKKTGNKRRSVGVGRTGFLQKRAETSQRKKGTGTKTEHMGERQPTVVGELVNRCPIGNE